MKAVHIYNLLGKLICRKTRYVLAKFSLLLTSTHLCEKIYQTIHLDPENTENPNNSMDKTDPPFHLSLLSAGKHRKLSKYEKK